MRKLLLSLFAFVSVNVFAQIHSVVTYRFSEPDRLSPKVEIDLKTDEFCIVAVDERTNYGFFEEGSVRVDFLCSKIGLGVDIVKEERSKVYLEINRGAIMNITTVNGATIDSISFSSDSYLGNLNPTEDDKGVWYFTSKMWKANSEQRVDSLTFMNSGTSTSIKQMMVYYTLPAEMLVPVANYKNNDILSSLSSMTLTFEKSMTVLDSSINVVSDKNVSKVMKATAEKNVVTLSLENAIETDGTYTIAVPAGSFKDAEGFVNKDLVYVLRVVVPKNTFNYGTVTPKPGKVESVTDSIVITFPKAIGRVDSNVTFSLSKNGEPELPMYADSVDNHNIELKFRNNIKEKYIEIGEYTIDFPEKTVYNAFYNLEGERYNPAFTLTYTIGDDEPVEPETPDTPDEPVVKPDSVLMEKAMELLTGKYLGVGYPAETSDARIALKTLLAKDTLTDEDLQAAIADFYAETNVTMPIVGKYYTISNVNTLGDTIFLAYANGVVSLTTEKMKTARFTAEPKADGTMVFKTLDGKFLHALIAEDKYDLTKPTNVTAEYNATVNNLKLAKLLVDGAKTEDLFGKMSIYGCLGKNLDNNQEVSAYVVVRHRNVTVATDASDGAEPKFTDNLSGAFVIEEAELETVETVTLAAELTPAVVARNTDKLNLKFTCDAPIGIANTTAAYFMDKDNAKVGAASIAAVEGQNAEFSVALIGLADGTYTLVIPEAMFTTEKDGKTANVAALQKTFTIDISEADEFVDNFLAIIYNEKLGYCFDTDLNDFILYEDTPMYVDTTKAVHLVDYWDMDKPIRTGYMKPITLAGHPYACQLFFNEPIVAGDLRPGRYIIIIEKATFGDANFGKYLADRSVKKSKCNVNPRLELAYDVDNRVASITDINVDDSAEKVIYTITGYRVKNMDLPGIYIVNGKKVIKK